MRDVVTEGRKGRERVRTYLRRMYEASKPDLDPSIPLGRPYHSYGEAQAIKRYYAAKARRGVPEQYPGLH